MARSPILPILSGAASLAAILAFLSSRGKHPSHLAPGVKYRAILRVSPQMPKSAAKDMVEGALRGTVTSVTNKRNATYITLEFVNATPHTVAPGETLLEFQGRKAILVSIREM